MPAQQKKRLSKELDNSSESYKYSYEFSPHKKSNLMSKDVQQSQLLTPPKSPLRKNQPRSDQVRRLSTRLSVKKEKHLAEDRVLGIARGGGTSKSIPPLIGNPLSEEQLMRLLPGSLFGSGEAIFRKGYWNVGSEMEFRRLRMKIDSEILRQAGKSPEELRLWRTLDRQFGCSLGDLFRYGLRPDLKPLGSSPASLNEFCHKLNLVLAHPIWRGSIANARYAFQRAVQIRTLNHHDPLGPPYSHKERPFLLTGRQWAVQTPWACTKWDEADMAFWMFKVHIADRVWRLFDQTQDHYMPRVKHPTLSLEESIFFLLRVSDLDYLRGLLSHPHLVQRLGFVAPEYFLDWECREAYQRVDGEEDARRGFTWTLRQKKDRLLGGYRESLVRSAMIRRGEGDLLLDTPTYDPDPLCQHLNLFSDEQLASYNGSFGVNAVFWWCCPDETRRVLRT